MLAASESPNEYQRLRALRSYAILDSPPEEALDDLTALAAHICAAPIALISLIDEDRQWVKSRVGIDLKETPLAHSFCKYTLRQPDLFIVPDATEDLRFAETSFVTGQPGIRFYAGAPLLTPDGQAIGALCVIDVQPRTLNAAQHKALRVLSRQVMMHLELQRQRCDLQASESKRLAMFEAEPECAKLVGADGTVHEVNLAGLQMFEAESLEALPERNFLPLVVPEDLATVRMMLANASRGEKCMIEYRLIGLAGTRRWLEMTGVPFYDKTTGEDLVLGISLDVTTRKLAEYRLHRLNRLHTVLSKTGEALLRVRDRAGLWDAVCRIVVETGLLRMAVIAEVETETGRVCWVASQGTGQEYLRGLMSTANDSSLGQGTVGTALRTGHPDFCNDIATDLRMAPWREGALRHGFRATASFPLKRGATTIGALVLFADEIDYFRDDEIGLMTAVADQLSFGLEAQEKDLAQRYGEAEIQRGSELLRAVADGTPDAVFVKDAQGRYLLVNVAAAQFVGRPGSEVLGQDDRELFGEENARGIMASDRVVMETNRPTTTEETLTAAGVTRTFMVTKAPFREAHGKVVGVIGISRDITERKQSEKRLAEQAALIDHAPDAITVLGLDNVVTFWSKGAERLYGWTRAEAVGRKVNQLLHPDPEIFATALETVLREGFWSGEIEKVAKGGHSFTVMSRWTLLRDLQERPLSILAICTDITERKKLELQFLRAQRMESIGTLAGGIAHDLNNSLAPIIMSLELLAAKFPDPDSAELLDILSTSARRGSDMVRQVLSFARGVEGERREVQIRHLIGEIEKIVNDTCLKNIQVTSHIPNDLWTVMGDATQLHQVLLNLCVNARDAMPHGGALILSAENIVLDADCAALSWNGQAKAGPYVYLQVIDTGTGMPPSVVEKIFDPFFTTKELNKGTGLGLSTTLAIVKSHGGFIRVYSELGQGTKFEIYLPAQSESTAGAVEEVAPEMPRGHGELILVVDDELAVRQITDHTLKAFGYRVALAPNGVEAVALFAREGHQIAAVLTDMMMPVMDGPTMIQVLRRMDTKVPIIAASGHFAEDRIAELGVQCLLAKPYRAELLLKALREVLSGGDFSHRDDRID